jgi:hypothetical protein
MLCNPLHCRKRLQVEVTLLIFLRGSQPRRQHNHIAELAAALCRSWCYPTKLNLESPLLGQTGLQKVLCAPAVMLVSSPRGLVCQKKAKGQMIWQSWAAWRVAES